LANYYEILGLNQSADSTHIRTAYKRLAMLYHPDRNPGNPQAEEMFKAINEAYHILSDPLKKSRYDSRFNSQQGFNAEEHWRTIQRQREQYARWQQVHKKRYTFDGHYFKIQGLAFLVFIIMSGICFGIIHTANYFVAAKYEKIRLHNKELVMKVNALFGSGKIDEAITQITHLHETEPLEFQFTRAKDSLVNELREQGEKEFEELNFKVALHFFEHLKKYEYPQRIETLRKISICQYNVGSFEEALQSLKQLHMQQPWNLELVYQIGLINLKFTGDHQEALTYFAMGKKLFKQSLTEIYGEAFSVVMNPNDVPDIYADMFEASALNNMELKKYRDAEKDLNWAIYLRPLRSAPYKLRAISKGKNKNYSLLCSDLNQAKKLGADGIDELRQRYSCVN
jgi:DnaJ-domain-containing protein 1